MIRNSLPLPPSSIYICLWRLGPCPLHPGALGPPLLGRPLLSSLHLLQGEEEDENARPLAESLLLAIADLLFCPDFTVQSHRRNNVVRHHDIAPWALETRR